MGELRRYRSIVSDNARWEGFRFRPGDIVISTPPKCGTTWTQMLCALLVLDSTTFDRPLAEISPWLDMLTNDLATVVASLEAQTHRRFIKTHTPLDGLPLDDAVTYICVGRDPRDVSQSWEHHLANMDFNAFVAARIAAVGLDDIAALGPIPTQPDDPLERFWQWADADRESATVFSLAEVLWHLQTFWERREEPGIALFHYADLSVDLSGQLRRLADVLSIEVSDDRLEELSAAATFDRMKARADDLVPDVGNRIWQSNTSFFHRGTSGQWRGLLDAEGLHRYDERVADLAPPDLATWAHNGWLAIDAGSTAVRGSEPLA